MLAKSPRVDGAKREQAVPVGPIMAGPLLGGDRRQGKIGLHERLVLLEQVATGDATQRVHEKEPVVHRRGPKRGPLGLGAVGRQSAREQVLLEFLDGGVEPIAGVVK